MKTTDLVKGMKFAGFIVGDITDWCGEYKVEKIMTNGVHDFDIYEADHDHGEPIGVIEPAKVPVYSEEPQPNPNGASALMTSWMPDEELRHQGNTMYVAGVDTAKGTESDRNVIRAIGSLNESWLPDEELANRNVIRSGSPNPMEALRDGWMPNVPPEGQSQREIPPRASQMPSSELSMSMAEFESSKDLIDRIDEFLK